MKQYLSELLVWLRIPQLYQRAVVWWEFHSDLRAYLKAFRMFLLHRSIATRNATFGSAMLVITKQIQSRQELQDMSYKQIMAAWRAGRLDYLMMRDDGLIGYGDKAFRMWVINGGQIKR